MLSHRTGKNILAVALFFCCLGLVVVYANLFSLYKTLNSHLGSSFINLAPIVILFLLISALLILFFKAFSESEGTFKERWGWFAAGIGCLALAMFIPDPQLGVKRIHVTEYLILSVLVRLTLSFHVRGIPLLIFSALLTALLGIHDEFLQGLHQSRTYGLKDMLVNAVAGLGGSLVWHGFHLFDKTEKLPRPNSSRWHSLEILYLIWLLFSVLALSIPMVAFLYSPVPPWLFLPLSATLVFWSCFGIKMVPHLRPGLLAITSCSFLYLLYPVAIHVFKIPFY